MGKEILCLKKRDRGRGSEKGGGIDFRFTQGVLAFESS